MTRSKIHEIQNSFFFKFFLIIILNLKFNSISTSAHSMHGEPGSDIPIEHTSFGKCNIRPGKHPSISPPTDFEMNFSNDYPNHDTDFVPTCTKEDFPTAFSSDRNGVFLNEENDESLNEIYKTKVKVQMMDTTHDMAVSSFHIPDNEEANYRYDIPVGGPHRHMWAAYGEYSYCPPGRFLHNLEHGAIVFIYHPCADIDLVNQLRTLAENCLWKHVITPWTQGLNETYPMAILAWGRICYVHNFFSENSKNVTIDFINQYAKAGGSGEGHCWGNGGFVNQLLKNATIVTTVEDSEICPKGFVKFNEIIDERKIFGEPDEVPSQLNDQELADYDLNSHQAIELDTTGSPSLTAITELDSLDTENQPETLKVVDPATLTGEDSQKSELSSTISSLFEQSINGSPARQLKIQKDQALYATIAILFIFTIIIYVAYRLGINYHKLKVRRSSSSSSEREKYSRHNKQEPQNNTQTTIGKLLNILKISNSRNHIDDRAEYVSLMNVEDNNYTDSDGEFSSISI